MHGDNIAVCKISFLGNERKLSKVWLNAAIDEVHFKITGIPHFLKVCVMPLHFYERPPVVSTCFCNWKKSEEDFYFHKKRQQGKLAFSVCVAESLSEAVHSQQQPEWQQPFLRSLLGGKLPQLWMCQGASALYLRSVCASISKMCLF